jgi:hypothetical protein
MYYLYTLSQNDLKNMDLEITEAKKYSIEQGGWSTNFYNMYEIIENEFGEFKGKTIVTGSNLSNEQIDYIIKKCDCIEYEN